MFIKRQPLLLILTLVDIMVTLLCSSAGARNVTLCRLGSQRGCIYPPTKKQNKHRTMKTVGMSKNCDRTVPTLMLEPAGESLGMLRFSSTDPSQFPSSLTTFRLLRDRDAFKTEKREICGRKVPTLMLEPQQNSLQGQYLSRS